MRIVEKWMAQINESANHDVQKILIANKIDLPSERKVSTEQGQQLAKKYHIPFLECSAKDGTNIEEIFFTLGKNIKQSFDKEASTDHGIGGGTQISTPSKTPKKEKSC